MRVVVRLEIDVGRPYRGQLVVLEATGQQVFFHGLSASDEVFVLVQLQFTCASSEQFTLQQFLKQPLTHLRRGELLQQHLPRLLVAGRALHSQHLIHTLLDHAIQARIRERLARQRGQRLTATNVVPTGFHATGQLATDFSVQAHSPEAGDQLRADLLLQPFIVTSGLLATHERRRRRSVLFGLQIEFADAVEYLRTVFNHGRLIQVLLPRTSRLAGKTPVFQFHGNGAKILDRCLRHSGPNVAVCAQKRRDHAGNREYLQPDQQPDQFPNAAASMPFQLSRRRTKTQLWFAFFAHGYEIRTC